MILKQLTLENIRSYTQEKIIFPKGNVLLCGDIGSGKSTILLAIEFALFGVKRGELSGASLLRNGRNQGSVELKFNLGPKEIIIKRVLKRTGEGNIKQDSGHIIIDGMKKEATAIELKSEIFALLGFPKELVSKSKDLVFRYTVYTPQEEMKHILFANKEERLDILRRVFNIDKYKRIRDNLQVVLKEIREQNKEYTGRIYSLNDKHQERKELLNSLKDIIQQAKELSPELKNSYEKINSLDEQYSKLEEENKKYLAFKNKKQLKEQEIKNLDEQKKQNDNDIEKIKKEIEKIDSKIKNLEVPDLDVDKTRQTIQDLETEIQDKEKDLNDKKNHNELIKDRIKNLKDTIRQYSKETSSRRQAEKEIIEKKQELKNLETVTKHKEDLEKNIERIQKIVENINSKITEKEVNIKNKEKIIENIKEINVCPTCHQDVSEDYKKQMKKESNENIDNLKKELQELQSKKDEYTNRIEESKENIKRMYEKEKNIGKVKAEIEALEKSFKEFDMKKNLIKEYEDRIQKLENNRTDEEIIKTLQKTINEKKNDLKELRKDYDKIVEKDHLHKNIKEKEERIRYIQDQMQAYSDKRKNLFSEKTKMEESIEDLKHVEKDIEKIKKELDEEKEKDKSLQIKKAEIIKERNNLLQQKDKLERDIKEMLHIKKKMNYLNEVKYWLENHFSNLTILIEKHIMQRVYNEFNELFKEWFDLIIEDDVINVRLDEEFTPVIVQNGYETDMGNLSGGEKTSVALSYRLALNKVINDCIENIKTKDLLILDEPTDGFSSEQLDKIREVLDEIDIGQIIIVSHEPKIESFVDSIIRIHKNEHVSSVI